MAPVDICAHVCMLCYDMYVMYVKMLRMLGSMYVCWMYICVCVYVCTDVCYECYG